LVKRTCTMNLQIGTDGNDDGMIFLF
jgi:hypothetical protein